MGASAILLPGRAKSAGTWTNYDSHPPGGSRLGTVREAGFEPSALFALSPSTTTFAQIEQIMLQVAFIRQHVELVKQRLAVKNFRQPELVDELLQWDDKRKQYQQDQENVQSK